MQLIILGRPKSLGFSVRCFKKLKWTFLVNPIQFTHEYILIDNLTNTNKDSPIIDFEFKTHTRCAVQRGGQELHVAVNHLKCANLGWNVLYVENTYQIVKT